MSILKAFASVNEAFESGALNSADPGQTFLVLGKAGELYELNLIAAYIWDQIRDGQTAIAELIKITSDAFMVNVDELEVDLNEIIDFWVSVGLLEKSE